MARVREQPEPLPRPEKLANQKRRKFVHLSYSSCSDTYLDYAYNPNHKNVISVMYVDFSASNRGLGFSADIQLATNQDQPSMRVSPVLKRFQLST